jgi:hypothetical protein
MLAACPSEEMFAAMLDGRTTASMYTHIERCSSCRELLRLLARSASDASDALPPGEIVSHCRIERPLGEGGMGLGTDREDGISAEIKRSGLRRFSDQSERSAL